MSKENLSLKDILGEDEDLGVQLLVALARTGRSARSENLARFLFAEHSVLLETLERLVAINAVSIYRDTYSITPKGEMLLGDEGV
jgi:hypothetical protein